ncbi:hypothetical protein [Roseiarcus sp.]|uniref:hypothetical protein n=1 Tax=Roseiarcus sp. TaxID=1969460 RepID=UPI003C74F911
MTSRPAKKLNPELLGIKRLRDYPLAFLRFARLLSGLTLRGCDGFAICREVSVRRRQAAADALVSLAGDRQRGAA